MVGCAHGLIHSAYDLLPLWLVTELGPRPLFRHSGDAANKKHPTAQTTTLLQCCNSVAAVLQQCCYGEWSAAVKLGRMVSARTGKAQGADASVHAGSWAHGGHGHAHLPSSNLHAFAMYWFLLNAADGSSKVMSKASASSQSLKRHTSGGSSAFSTVCGTL